MNLGILGSESTHVAAYIDIVNRQHAIVGARITAVLPENARQVPSLGLDASVRLCSTTDELGAGVDAIIIASRRASSHYRQALPFAQAGIPLLIDKPFTDRVADAAALLDVAAHTGRTLTSYSALRWISAMDEFLGGLAPVGQLSSVRVCGGADPASAWDGLWFYGVHVVESLLHVLAFAGCPLEITDLHVTATSREIVAEGRSADVRVELRFVDPPSSQAIPVTLRARGSGGELVRTLHIEGNYLLPGLEKFLGAVGTGRVPLSEPELLAPIRLLTAIIERT